MSECIFDSYKKGMSIRSLKTLLSKTEHIISRYEDKGYIKDISANDLSDIIYYSEMIALRGRGEIESKTDDYESELYDLKSLASGNFPCDVIFDGEAFIVTTPLTIRRRDSRSEDSLKKNYLLASYVMAAIRVYRNENGEEFFLNDCFTHGNLVALVIRKAIKYNKNVHCDNDNLENGRIINVICSALGVSDNCRVMDLISCFRICEKEEDIGTTFIITRRENIYKYL